MARIPLSGTQHTIRAGGYEAVIASVGASLRSLTFEGRDLIVPFDADELRPGFRGTTLAPWPNRIVDGRYTFGGVEHQVPITEPARNHALHGLASWQHYEVTDKNGYSVTMTATIEPQAGYPWRVAIETTFALTSDGLTQTVTAVNESAEPAPWGTGPHPYLRAGAGPLDEWTFELPARQVLEVTPDRLSPVGLTAVDAVDPQRFDFRVARPVGAAEIDHAYTALELDAAGFATVRVTEADGHGVELVWDAVCPWVQVCTADTGVAQTHRIGLAVEPMTCAPDAFNADRYDFDPGLIVLEPEVASVASWRIAAI